jgi:hypothetical protein
MSTREWRDLTAAGIAILGALVLAADLWWGWRRG